MAEEEALRDLAVFANEFCDIAGWRDPPAQEQALQALTKRFEPSVPLTPASAHRLLGAALEKLEQHAPILEIDVAGSSFCESARHWGEWAEKQAEAEESPAPVG